MDWYDPNESRKYRGQSCKMSSWEWTIECYETESG